MVTRFPDAPRRVDVRAIESEVQRLWKAASQQPEVAGRADGPATLTRVCMLTLVVVAADAVAIRRASTVLDRLIARYPCRAITVRLRATEQDALDAWVSMRCDGTDPARPRVCCEQIVLEACGQALPRVPGIVLPLLVPDLPVYLWWHGDVPAEGDPAAGVARHLAEGADCLIVDSQTAAKPLETLAEASALAAPLDGGLRDLTWGRLSEWRDTIARIFDPPAMAGVLDRVERAAIVSEDPGAGGVPIAALLLAGWLASRLGWEVVGACTDPDTRVVRARFRQTGPAGRPERQAGEVISVDVRGGRGLISAVEFWADGSQPAFVGFTQGAQEHGFVTIEARTGRGRPRRQVAGLVVPDDVALLASELDLPMPGGGLAEALDVVRRIASGSGRRDPAPGRG